MNLKEEKDLIAKAKKDPEVFGEIFEAYYDMIFRYTLKRTANVEVAQDITSEVFFKAYHKLWQFQWRNIPFSAWLYKIAHHEISYFFRKHKHSSLSLDELLQKNIINASELQEYNDELKELKRKLQNEQDFLFLQKKIVGLPDRYQEVIMLRFFENKKIKDISVILQKPEGTIKTLLTRGLKMLKQRIINDETSESFQYFKKEKDN